MEMNITTDYGKDIDALKLDIKTIYSLLEKMIINRFSLCYDHNELYSIDTEYALVYKTIWKGFKRYKKGFYKKELGSWKRLI